MLGWIFRRLRRLHLISLILTLLSWFVLGIWYGIGYCPFTDWHWTIRRRLGYDDVQNSYIEFLIGELTGLDFTTSFVDALTMIIMVLSLCLSIAFNLRDLKKPSG